MAPQVCPFRTVTVGQLTFEVKNNTVWVRASDGKRRPVKWLVGESEEALAARIAACIASATCNRGTPGSSRVLDNEATAHAGDKCQPRRSVRPRYATSSFVQSEYTEASGSSYWSRNIGSRHERVRAPGDSYDERGAARDKAKDEVERLEAQLIGLQSKLCNLVEAAAGVAPESGAMEHAAAVAMFGALHEVLSSSGLEVPRKSRPARSFTVRKQQVDVFYCFFKSGYRPDARSFNVGREDITSILKHGCALYGEWFCEGGRLPGGDHSNQLPDGLRDLNAFPPPCPSLQHEVDVTDGCAAQFAGRNNYHQIAEWKVKTGVDRNHLRLEAMCGKGPCDGAGNTPQSTVRMAISDGKMLDPGTRELTLFNAIHKQTPCEAKMAKHGWWAIGRIFYGFFDTKLFTKEAVPESDGFNGSSLMHQVVGLCESAETAQREGPVWARGIWCGCTSCSERQFSQCLMKAEFGLPKLQYCHRKVDAIPRQPRSVLLREFASTLCADMIVVVHAASADQDIEGSYWLARLLGPAYQAPSDDLNSLGVLDTQKHR